MANCELGDSGAKQLAEAMRLRTCPSIHDMRKAILVWVPLTVCLTLSVRLTLTAIA